MVVYKSIIGLFFFETAMYMSGVREMPSRVATRELAGI